LTKEEQANFLCLHKVEANGQAVKGHGGKVTNVRFGSKADICSAKGHVRFASNSDRESEFPQTVMSALPLKADMCGALAYVRFGPLADITSFGELGAVKTSMTSADFQCEGDRPRIIFLSRFYFTSAKSQKSRKTVIL
jgi:hypothetical protein